MTPHTSQPIRVFCSYAREDAEMRNKVGKHLGFLKREGKIEYWYDGKIKAGEEWRGEIDKQLDSADIILLLISADFVDSNFCYSVEMKRAMERHDAGEAAVIPILLHPCDWQSAPFGKLNALPRGEPVSLWQNPEQALHEVAKGVRIVVEEMIAARSAEQPSPLGAEVVSVHSLRIPPPPVIEFVPRDDRDGRDIVERLREELAPHKNRFIALWGAGGVGKTAIAAEAARALTGAFNQRVVWVSADGREDFSLTSLLDAIAIQLRQSDSRKLALELKKEQVREVVMIAPTLIVLDNFETIEPQEKNLCAEWLSQPALCSALVTTRQNVETARNITIEAMSQDEADALLDRLLSEVHDRRAFYNLDRDKLIWTAEANPLVLQWIVGQIDLAQSPEEVLDDLAHGEGTAAKRVFDRSYNLPQLSNGGRAVLLALSLFVPSTMRPALAEVAGLTGERNKKRFKESVKNLSALWLIRTTDGGKRLTIEGLTRELVKSRLSKESQADLFQRRFVAYFLGYATKHSNQSTPEHLRAMEEEKDNLSSALDIALERKDGSSLIKMFHALQQFLYLHDHWDEAIKRGEHALGIAQKLGDKWYTGAASNFLGTMFMARGDNSLARRHYETAAMIARELNNQQGLCATLYQLGKLAREQGDLIEARQLVNESLKIGQSLKLDDHGIAFCWHELGSLDCAEGNLQEAEVWFNKSLSLLRKLGEKAYVTECLESIGNLRLTEERYSDAQLMFEESLDLAVRLSLQFRIASVKHSLGLLAEAMKDKANAAQLFQAALSIFERLGSSKRVMARESLARVNSGSK